MFFPSYAGNDTSVKEIWGLSILHSRVLGFIAKLVLTVVGLVIVADLALVLTGWLEIRQAFRLIVLINGSLILALFGVYFCFAYVISRRTQRRLFEAFIELLHFSKMGRMVIAECRGYKAIYLCIVRRPDVEAHGNLPFRSDRGTWGLSIAFIAAAMIELLVVHFIVANFHLRMVLLVLSLSGIVSFIGLCCAKVAFPHFISSEELVLKRYGNVLIRVSRADIESVAISRNVSFIEDSVTDGSLCLGSPDGTNVAIALRRSVYVEIQSFLPSRRSSGDVEKLFIFVNDAEGFCSALRVT